MSTGRFWTRVTPFRGWRMGRHLEDVFTGVPTSSRRHFWRRHLRWHHPRWRRRKWRQPGLGESFSTPPPLRRRRKMARWRPFRCRSPSWMTSFAEPEMRLSKMATGSGKAAILRLRLNGVEKLSLYYSWLTHWGRVTHICVSKLTIIGSDNGLSPDRRQAIIWTNAGLSLLIGPLGTNFSEILIENLTF